MGLVISALLCLATLAISVIVIQAGTKPGQLDDIYILKVSKFQPKKCANCFCTLYKKLH